MMEQRNQSDYMLGSQVIILQLQDGTARLIDLDGKFHVASKTGCLILFETLKFGSQHAIDRLISDYAIDRSLAEVDVKTFLDGLEQENLIHRTTTPVSKHEQYQREPWRLRSLFQFLLNLLLRCVWLLPDSRSFRLGISLEIKVWVLLTLAYISVRLCSWSKTVELWQTQMRKSAAIVNPIIDNNTITEYVHAVSHYVRTITACHPLPIACKERSLCGWWLMCSVGIPSTLKLGVNLFPFTSHAWCEIRRCEVGECEIGECGIGEYEIAGEIIGDDPERCAAFTPVYWYDT